MKFQQLTVIKQSRLVTKELPVWIPHQVGLAELSLGKATLKMPPRRTYCALPTAKFCDSAQHACTDWCPETTLWLFHYQQYNTNPQCVVCKLNWLLWVEIPPVDQHILKYLTERSILCSDVWCECYLDHARLIWHMLFVTYFYIVLMVSIIVTW